MKKPPKGESITLLTYLFLTMKKGILFSAAAAALLLTSCGVVRTEYYSATKLPVATVVSSANVADLQVGDRVTYRYTTTAEDRRAGENECKNAAVWNLLKVNGNADVLVSPEFHYDKSLNIVEVTGRPAFYKNFRGAN